MSILVGGHRGVGKQRRFAHVLVRYDVPHGGDRRDEEHLLYGDLNIVSPTIISETKQPCLCK